MVTLENILLRMRQVIKRLDPCTQNLPISISISVSGTYFVIKYSLSRELRTFTDLGLLIDEMDAHLKVLEELEIVHKPITDFPLGIRTELGENPWPWGV